MELFAAHRMPPENQQKQPFKLIWIAQQGAVASAVFQSIREEYLCGWRVERNAKIFEWLNPHVNLRVSNVEVERRSSSNHKTERIPGCFCLIDGRVQHQSD